MDRDLKQKQPIEVCKHDHLVPGTAEAMVPFYKSKVIWAVTLYIILGIASPSLREWADINVEKYDRIIDISFGVFLILLRNSTGGRIKWKV